METNHDKTIICLSLHSGSVTVQYLVWWDNTRKNKADGKDDTTDLTTKEARLDA